jgi:hypothetical protein
MHRGKVYPSTNQVDHQINNWEEPKTYQVKNPKAKSMPWTLIWLQEVSSSDDQPHFQLCEQHGVLQFWIVAAKCKTIPSSPAKLKGPLAGINCLQDATSSSSCECVNFLAQ